MSESWMPEELKPEPGGSGGSAGVEHRLEAESCACGEWGLEPGVSVAPEVLALMFQEHLREVMEEQGRAPEPLWWEPGAAGAAGSGGGSTGDGGS